MSDTKVRIVSNVPRMYQATRTAMGQATEVATRYAAREAERLASQGFAPPASRPGDPPKMRTQELRKIEGSVRIKEDKKGVLGIYGTDVDYGLWVELGTSEMAPRPFLRPALDKAIKEVPAILRKAFQRNYRISGGLK